MKWVIYVLKHPRTDEVRYVGWTKQGVDKRLREHIREAVRGQRTHRHRWLLSLVSIGLEPAFEVIEHGTGDGWSEAERRWIAFYRSYGARLVNGTDGGEGTIGWGTFEQLSQAAKKGHAKIDPEKRSAALRKAWASRTAEERSAIGKRAAAALTQEQRSARVEKRWKNATPEQLALHGLKASVNTSVWNASLTPELRSERARNAALSVPREQRLLNSAKANVAQKAYWDSKKAKA